MPAVVSLPPLGVAVVSTLESLQRGLVFPLLVTAVTEMNFLTVGQRRHILFVLPRAPLYL